MMMELGGTFGDEFPPENNVANSWLPLVFEPIMQAMKTGPLKFVPFYRPGKPIVDKAVALTNIQASAEMRPKVFPLEKQFLAWEKYQEENFKNQQSGAAASAAMDVDAGSAQPPGEADDAEAFDAMFQDNRFSGSLRDEDPLSQEEMEPPVIDQTMSRHRDSLPNQGPPHVEHLSCFFSFNVFQEYSRSKKDPEIQHYPIGHRTLSLVDYMTLAAYWDFQVRPSTFDSADCRHNSSVCNDYQEYIRKMSKSTENPVSTRVQAIPGADTELPKTTRPNTRTTQLSVFSLNLGNLLRKPKSKLAPSQLKKSDNVQDSMLFNILAKNSSHVFCLCEADGLQRPEVQTFLSDNHWQFEQSYDRNMAVGARTGENATLTILYDTTDPRFDLHRNYKDDPTVLGAKEKYLWYMIVEVVFGTEYHPNEAGPPTVSADRVTRSDLSSARILVFHMDNQAAANKPYVTRQKYRQMMVDIARYQVDMVTGDANASMYRAFKNQTTPSIAESSLHKMMTAMGRFINYWAPGWPNYVDIQMVSSNSSEHLDKIKAYYSTQQSQRQGEAPSVDCIVLYTLSWGHSALIQGYRRDFGYVTHPDTQFRVKLSEEEIQARIAEHLRGDGGHDYQMSVTNYYMLFTNDFLLLGASDADWHTPLQTMIKVGRGLATRKKSDTAQEYREQKHKAKRTAQRAASSSGRSYGSYARYGR